MGIEAADDVQKGVRGQVEQLEYKLSIHEQALEARTTERFHARLAEEARRAQRYNHYFSVIVMNSNETAPRDMFTRLRHLLRDTDLLEVIIHRVRAPRGRRFTNVIRRARFGRAAEHQRVVAVLPETDRTGAEIALGRLRGGLPEKDNLLAGLSVFPDDTTDPHELLSLAASRA